ncbi:roundabout homolog 2-like [Montipora foliosa]|uniref:roundabout homolog 2-like n=1 Tax=Montipora foliosa TaxID=591990 RepID=UPI0035F17154
MINDFYAYLFVLAGIILLQGSSLTVAISARIQVHPMNISLNPGVKVTLDCLVQNGGPADTIQWFKDDQPIIVRQRHSSSPRESSRLSLINITQTNAGRYECRISKGAESDTDLYYLNVEGEPVITKLSTEIVAMEDEDKRIPCEAIGWPKPKIRWKRDNEYIKDDENYEIEAHPTLNRVTLLIKAANEDHEGEFFCEASNSYGTVEKMVWIMIRYQLQKILVKSHFVVARSGSNTTLVCQAPYAIMESSTEGWSFNGKQLPHNQIETFQADKLLLVTLLHIHNVSKQDSGLYECFVHSLRNEGRNNITLIVDEKDNLQNISSILETVQTATNRQVQLKCITFNSPFLEVKNVWFFRGIILNETDPRYATYAYQFNSSETWHITQMSLWIRNVSHSDFGIYSCVVNSSVGMSLKNISLVQMEAEIDFSSSGQPEEKNTLIILFPLVAGGLLILTTASLFLRRLQKKRHDQKHQEEINDGEFIYDVFVTFSTKDHQWVANKLIPFLERQRINYCIHSRDFELGRPLVDNMAESVYSSRKVLAVMSKNYMESKFCRGELEMALHRSKTGRDGSLLVVTIDGIKKKKMPKALRESTFVDYHSDTGNSWEKKLMRFLGQTEEKNSNLLNTKL